MHRAKKTCGPSRPRAENSHPAAISTDGSLDAWRIRRIVWASLLTSSDPRSKEATAALKPGLMGWDVPFYFSWDLKKTTFAPLAIRGGMPEQVRAETHPALKYQKPTRPCFACTAAPHLIRSVPHGTAILSIPWCLGPSWRAQEQHGSRSHTTLLPDLYQWLGGGCRVLMAPGSWDRSRPARPGWKEGRKL